MQLLKDRICKDGILLPGGIVKVDSFLNHQLDPNLLVEIGHAFYHLFKNEHITKILTIEASGIAPAITTAIAFGVPVVFAKKQKSMNVGHEVYTSQVFSYTKNVTYDIVVSKEYLKKEDRVLIIDDFLATGHALRGLSNIVTECGAELIGVGIVIEKSFQNGGKELRKSGLRIESLAKISSITEEGIVFD